MFDMICFKTLRVAGGASVSDSPASEVKHRALHHRR